MNAFLYASASLAIVLAVYLATGTGLPRTSRRLLAVSMLTIAALNLLTLLQIADPDHPVLLIRPGLVVAFPALLFLHIATAARPEQKLRVLDAINIVGPLAAIGVRMMSNMGPLLDALLVLLHLGYLGLTAWVTRQGASSFSHLGVPLSLLLERWRRLVLAFLLVVLLIDLLIMFEIGDNGNAAPQLWVFGLVGMLLVFGFTYLLVSSLHRTGPLAWASNRFRHHNPDYEALITRLEAELLVSRDF